VVRLSIGRAALAQAKVCRRRDCSREDTEPPYAQEAVGPRAWERWRRVRHSARVLWPSLRRAAALAAMTEEEEEAALAKAYRAAQVETTTFLTRFPAARGRPCRNPHLFGAFPGRPGPPRSKPPPF